MRFFRTTIHLQNSSKSASFRLPYFSVKGWALVQKIVRLGLVLLFIQAGILFAYEHLQGKALEQRRLLQTELRKEQKKLASLDTQMEHFFQDEDLLHLKFGLALADRSPREMGTGGTIDPMQRLLWASSPMLEFATTLNNKVEQLELKIEQNQQTFSLLANYMDQQYSHWRHIPSISPVTGRYSSPFGRRVHPVTGEVGKMHYGIDISNGRWIPIFATADGVVDIAKFSDTFGNYVAIDHGNGFLTKYGHMQAYAVKPGQFVKRYQLIGYMGNTGLSAGTHVHYEVWYNNEAINPLRYILPDDYAVQ